MLRNRDALLARYRYFQTKYREYREQFIALRQRYYLIECAWCQRRIRWQRKESAAPGDTSHGICPSCAADMLRDIAKRRSTPRRLYQTP